MEEIKKYDYDETIEAQKAALEDYKKNSEMKLILQAELEKEYWENKSIDYGIEIDLIKSLIKKNLEYCCSIGDFSLRKELLYTKLTGTYFIPTEEITKNMRKAGFFTTFGGTSKVKVELEALTKKIELGDNPSIHALSYLDNDDLIIESFKNREENWLLKDMSNLAAHFSSPKEKERNTFLAIQSKYKEICTGFYQSSNEMFVSEYICTTSSNIYVNPMEIVLSLQQMLKQTGFEVATVCHPCFDDSVSFIVTIPELVNGGSLKLELLNKYFGKQEN